jgi:hypothetical protein
MAACGWSLNLQSVFLSRLKLGIKKLKFLRIGLGLLPLLVLVQALLVIQSLSGRISKELVSALPPLPSMF